MQPNERKKASIASDAAAAASIFANGSAKNGTPLDLNIYKMKILQTQRGHEYTLEFDKLHQKLAGQSWCMNTPHNTCSMSK